MTIAECERCTSHDVCVEDNTGFGTEKCKERIEVKALKELIELISENIQAKETERDNYLEDFVNRNSKEV